MAENVASNNEGEDNENAGGASYWYNISKRIE
jgi:hypothetical protein